MFTSDLLLSFDQENDIDREIPCFLKRFTKPEKMGEDLSLIIRGPPCRDHSILNRRLKGRRVPEIEGIGGLNVVVSVNENCFSIRFKGSTGKNHGMSLCGMDRGTESGGLKPFVKPLGALLNLRLISGVSGDTLKTKKREKLIDGRERIHGSNDREIFGLRKGKQRLSFPLNF